MAISFSDLGQPQSPSLSLLICQIQVLRAISQACHEDETHWRGEGTEACFPAQGEGIVRAPLPSSRQGVGGVGISLPPADTIKHDKGHTTALQESSSSWETKLCCLNRAAGSGKG